MRRAKRPGKDDEDIAKLSERIQIFIEVSQEYISVVRENTLEIMALKSEVRRQRKADENNTEFLQSLVKEFLIGQKEENKSKWEVVKSVLNWTLKIGAVIILALLGIKTVYPDI